MKSQAAVFLLLVMSIVVLQLHSHFSTLVRMQRRSIMQQMKLAKVVEEARLTHSTYTSHLLFSVWRAANYTCQKRDGNISDFTNYILSDLNSLNISLENPFTTIHSSKTSNGIRVNATGASLSIRTVNLRLKKNISISREVKIDMYGIIDTAEYIKKFNFTESLKKNSNCSKELSDILDGICDDFRAIVPTNSSFTLIFVLNDTHCAYNLASYGDFNITSSSYVPCKFTNATGVWCPLIYLGTISNSTTYSPGASNRTDYAFHICNR